MTSAHADAVLTKIVAWARNDANVLALVMTGSRARNDGHLDEFSDFDLEIIAARPDELIEDDAWWRSFGGVLVHLPTIKGPRYETRLVFYEGGCKVDFSLCGAERVREMAEGGVLDGLYERGYRVLVDKQGIAAAMPAPSRSLPLRPPPAQAEFAATVEEFWFEAAHIPRYLLRDELWVVKFRDWTMKTLLLRMLEWYAAACSARPVDVWHIGVHMKEWADAATWAEIRGTFAAFDVPSSWDALLATARLFRRLAMETATAAGLMYPAGVDDAVWQYVTSFGERIAAAADG